MELYRFVPIEDVKIEELDNDTKYVVKRFDDSNENLDWYFGYAIKSKCNLMRIVKVLLPSKIDAIKFAEWLSKNEWQKKIHTHPNKVGKYYSDIHCEYKSIEDLYSIFILEYSSRTL